MSLWPIIRRILFKLFAFILTLLVLAVLTVIFPLLLPTYLYRFLLSKSIKLFRPDLSKILTTRSQILATDDIYKHPRATLLVQLLLENNFQSIENEREFMLQNLVLVKDEAGDLKRPEFQQYIESWMGFYFWKWDTKFDMKNHFYEYDGVLKGDSYDESVLYQVGIEMISKPYKKKQSPWEFILFRNCTTDEYPKPFTAMMMRYHHSLADGFSILKLTHEIISTEGTLDTIKPFKPRLTSCQKIGKTLSFIVRAPFEAVETFLTLYDKNEWHGSSKKLSGVIHGAFHRKISVNFIKELKNLHSVTFTSVVLAGLCGGIRRFMIQHKVKLPKYIHALIPIPAFDHPDKLRNLATICYINLPIGEEDPVERLHMIDKDLIRIRESTLPLLLFYLCPLVGGLFPFLTRIFTQQILVTAIISNFPGPQDLVIYNNKQNPVLDMMFGGGLLPGSIGLGLTAISYNGSLRIGAGLDEIFVPENTPIKNLVEHVAQEFDVLKAMGSV